MNSGCYSFRRVTPKVGQQVFLAPGSRVIGDVVLADQSSIWYNAVLRADIAPIRIGKMTNIQDNAVLHVVEDQPCEVGDYVTVGHNAILHGCKIGDHCLIGMGAVVLNGAEIGEHCIIGAGALIPEGKKIPPRSVVLGAPGKTVRAVSKADEEGIWQNCRQYYEYSLEFQKESE